MQLVYIVANIDWLCYNVQIDNLALKEENMIGFGERLKKLRNKTNLTQAELAEKLNLHVQTISRWERGSSLPDMAMYGMLSSILAVSLEELWGLPVPNESVNGLFDVVKLGKAIAVERKRLNESQDDLANVAMVSSDTVSKWERGVICPDIDTFLTLANHFAILPSALYYARIEQDDKKTAIEVTKKPKLKIKRIIISIILTLSFLALSIPIALIFLIPGKSTTSECDHNYELNVTVPTCTSQGYTTYTCSKCGDNYKDYIDTIPHTSSAWITDREPTCTQLGSKHTECIVCGARMSMASIEKLLHDYSYIIIPPKDYNQGYYLYTCNLCGDSYKDNYFYEDKPDLKFNFNYFAKTCEVTGVYNKDVMSITIPAVVDGFTVTKIGARAFSDCVILREIVLPDTIEEIGEYAFYRCVLLDEIVIPEKVTCIEEEAFCNCKALTRVVLPEGISRIRYSAFSGCENLKTVNIPSSVTVIEGLAFNGCKKLNEVILPEGLLSVGGYSFHDCASLEKIFIPKSVIYIGDNAFSACSNLMSVTFEETEGWKVDEIVVDANLLLDSKTAAEHLTKKYNSYIWIRE